MRAQDPWRVAALLIRRGTWGLSRLRRLPGPCGVSGRTPYSLSLILQKRTDHVLVAKSGRWSHWTTAGKLSVVLPPPCPSLYHNFHLKLNYKEARRCCSRKSRNGLGLGEAQVAPLTVDTWPPGDVSRQAECCKTEEQLQPCPSQWRVQRSQSTGCMWPLFLGSCLFWGQNSCIPVNMITDPNTGSQHSDLPAKVEYHRKIMRSSHWEYAVGTSLMVQGLRILLLVRGTQVRSLVEELRPHIPQSH